MNGARQCGESHYLPQCRIINALQKRTTTVWTRNKIALNFDLGLKTFMNLNDLLCFFSSSLFWCFGREIKISLAFVFSFARVSAYFFFNWNVQCACIFDDVLSMLNSYYASSGHSLVFRTKEYPVSSIMSYFKPYAFTSRSSPGSECERTTIAKAESKRTKKNKHI